MCKLPEIVYGERVILRVVTPQDSEQLNQLIVASYDNLKKWVIWAAVMPSIEDTDNWIQQAQEKFLAKKELNLLICEKNSGVILGGVGLHDINWEIKSFEIGYWGGSEYLNRGYFTDAVNALLNFVLENFLAKRVYLTTDDRNLRSIKLAERLGFQLEGILHNERLGPDGNLRNTRVYAVWK